MSDIFGATNVIIQTFFNLFNGGFILFYAGEMIFKNYALGVECYFSSLLNRFDFLVTVLSR